MTADEYAEPLRVLITKALQWLYLTAPEPALCRSQFYHHRAHSQHTHNKTLHHPSSFWSPASQDLAAKQRATVNIYLGN